MRSFAQLIHMMPVCEKLLEVAVNKPTICTARFQSGFKGKHSCEAIFNAICHKWYSAMEEREIMTVVFLNFRRAFETIYLDISITCNNNSLSDPVLVNYVVPQGTYFFLYVPMI